MPMDGKPAPGDGPKEGAVSKWTVLMVAIFAFVAGSGVYAITTEGRSGSIGIGPRGVTIEIKADDRLENLIERAKKEQPNALKGVLAAQGIYSIDDRSLVDALRAGPLTAEVRDGVRRLLYDLSGPFEPPGTLTGATAHFYQAVAELEKAIRDLPEDMPDAFANPFFAELWMNQLDQSGVFVPRAFGARVTHLAHVRSPPEDGRYTVYVCSGSDLVGRSMSLFLGEEDRPPYLIDAVARIDLSRFNCEEPSQTLPRYLARLTARIGMPKETFAAIWGPVDDGKSMPSVARAHFQLAPRNYQPIAQLPVEIAAEGGDE